MRGLDLNDASPEGALVVRSVLPVFSHETEGPESVGSCLLVRIDGQAFVVTAAHVLQQLHETTGRFVVAVGGRLVRLYAGGFVTNPDDAADVGLVPLVPAALSTFLEAGAVLIEREMIDEAERGDGIDLLNMVTNTYFVFGFPGSRSWSRVSHATRQIHAKGYLVKLTLGTCFPDGVSPHEHLILDYDEKEILQDRERKQPPSIYGVSGGGIFRFQRGQPETMRLVGIAIERHKRERIIVGTRIMVAATLAREVIARYPDALLNRSDLLARVGS